jgi:hypothetical protein
MNYSRKTFQTKLISAFCASLWLKRVGVVLLYPPVAWSGDNLATTVNSIAQNHAVA